MNEKYNFGEIESKWQQIWSDEQAFKTSDDNTKEELDVLVEVLKEVVPRLRAMG